MLSLSVSGRRLTIDGAAARTDPASRLSVVGGGGTAIVRDNDAEASIVPLPGDAWMIADLDLSGVTGAGAEIDWLLSATAGIPTTIRGTREADVIVLRVSPEAGPQSSAVWGLGGSDSITGADSADDLHGGGGADTLAGGAGDDSLWGDAGNDVIDGGSGSDTILFSGSAALTVDLSLAGAQDTGQGLDRLSGIENVVAGAGDDRLRGDAGDNLLDGGAGADTLAGGAGNDRLVVDDPRDVVTELAGEGEDTVLAACDWVLGANLEHLTLTGSALRATGNDDANRLTGNDGDNTLTGGLGDDTLTGGRGADWLAGGDGDDIYEAEQGDTIIEHYGEGSDRVRSAGGLTLMANIEVLELTGTGDSAGTGNYGANLLIGNSGSNTLDGGGGADTLMGGAGDDWYAWDPLDTIIDAEGRNGLVSDSTILLPDMFDDLRLTGAGIKDGTGNARANRLYGNDDDNVLDGGDGSDTLLGGYGNDRYLLGAGDVVVELADHGFDTVLAGSDMILPDHVEVLELVGTALNGTGNAGDNRLVGTAGNNRLSGGGGSDTMIGGAGDDIYFADEADLIVEALEGGYDTIYSSASIDLPLGVELLVLTGTAEIFGRGNAFANRIYGNGAANLIDGRGGADTLSGGGGDDLYMLSGGELVAEGPTGGYDTVLSRGDLVLTAWVERGLLGGILPVSLRGNPQANLLMGNVGANLIIGGGGSDTMQGGAGNDTYVTDGGDLIAELDGQGSDTIRTTVSLILPANIEHLWLDGSASIWGAGNALANRITGNSGANTLNGGAGADTLVGGLGNDTYVSDGRDAIYEVQTGGWDTLLCAASFTLPAWIEAGVLTTTASSLLLGNTLANRLTGNAGADRLIGGAGADTLIGGAGNDTYVWEPGDGIVEAVGGGYDTVQSASSCTLGANLDALVLTGYASVRGTGNVLANRITGNAGANILDGGGGADLLLGGGGNDIYVWTPGDGVVEAANAGWDTILAWSSCTLPLNVEALTMQGTGAIRGTGNAQANRILGNTAANWLIGGGGADTLVGGLGNDTYLVDAYDGIYEAANGGWDLILSPTSRVLPLHVEGLTLLGTAFYAVGNTLANRLTGGAVGNRLLGLAGDDWLYGLGGNDTLEGGTGNDRLAGGTGADRFVFAAGGGIDTVTDFENGRDRIAIASGAERFADLRLIATTGGTLVTFADSRVLVAHVPVSALDAGDFLFL